MQIGIYKINPGGSGPVVTPDLQEVTDQGNITTNDIFIPAVQLYDAPNDNNVTVIVDDSMLRLERIYSTFIALLDFRGLSADRTYLFPDKSGTIALVSDIPPPSAVNFISGGYVTPAFTGSTINIPISPPFVPVYGNPVAHNASTDIAMQKGFHINISPTTFTIVLLVPVVTPISIDLRYIVTD